MRAFRLCKTKWIESAFDGEGARLNAGRWNSEGIAVVYTSESLSLATLEVMVHLEDFSVLAKFYSHIVVTIPDECIEALRPESLPEGWNSETVTITSMMVGDLWVAEKRSLALKVPSVISHGEMNVLINPNHADFRMLKFKEPITFSIDPRLARILVKI
ncbi:MAG TPA: RES family NAD+ phosphorylase [Chthoniobacterales bacterium]